MLNVLQHHIFSSICLAIIILISALVFHNIEKRDQRLLEIPRRIAGLFDLRRVAADLLRVGQPAAREERGDAVSERHVAREIRGGSLRRRNDDVAGDDRRSRDRQRTGKCQGGEVSSEDS